MILKGADCREHGHGHEPFVCGNVAELLDQLRKKDSAILLTV